MLAYLLAIGLLSTPTSAAAQAAEHVLFDGRRLENARVEGPPWTRVPRGLESTGPGAVLVSDMELGAGDVAARVRLSLARRAATNASLRIGNNVLVLDGDRGGLVLDGPLTGHKPARIDDASRWFAPGRAFDLEARRSGTALEFLIDGKVVYQTSVGTEVLGAVALAPGTNTLTLERLVLVGPVFQAAPVARDDRLQAQVEGAVRRALDWLLARQLRDGSWRHCQYGFRGGQTALSAYTLLRAGLEPDHPSVQRAFAFLDGVEPGETYTIGLMCMAYEALRDPARAPRIEALAKEIADWSVRGQWGYPKAHEQDFAVWLNAPSAPDLSNTQYAVLGLRAARHAGIETPDKLWLDVLDRTLSLQTDAAPGANATRKSTRADPAGFRYAIGREPTISMTAAGVAVLGIVREALGGRLRGERLLALERGIQGGVAWLDERFTPGKHPDGSDLWHYYSLYGIERIGTLLELPTLAGQDWYEVVASWLLRQQSDNGAWGIAKPFGVASHHADQDEADTCFAILFLKRASRPTVETQGQRWRAREIEDPTESVRLRASGDTTVVLWIAGFSESLRNELAGATGLRVARVEYLEGERVLATVEADPARPWTDEGFALRHVLRAPGAHVLRARVHVVDPAAPAGAREPLRAVDSREVTVRSAGFLDPWMLDAAGARARNLLHPAGAKASSSSVHGAEDAGRAVDGREDTRWVSAAGDAEPWLLLELPKAVRCDTVVLGQGGGARDLAGRYDRIEEVAVRLNRDKEPLAVTLPEDELQPAILTLAKLQSVSRIEIRVTRRSTGGEWKGHVALTEVGLERRGSP